MSDKARREMLARAYGVAGRGRGASSPPRSATIDHADHGDQRNARPPSALGSDGGAMATRAQMCEQRLRDTYPQILRDEGLDEAMIAELMEAYDSPIVETQSPVSAASLYAPYRPASRAEG